MAEDVIFGEEDDGQSSLEDAENSTEETEEPDNTQVTEPQEPSTEDTDTDPDRVDDLEKRLEEVESQNQRSDAGRKT